MTCTRCGNTGFLNTHLLSEVVRAWLDEIGPHEFLEWLQFTGLTEPGEMYEDVQVCDCCGNGEDDWHGEPGEHYNTEDPMGKIGPYAYNGGLAECH